ncbi:Membrane protein involved in the export of O-antigen and teichoic acid [Ekhidna lutea]|uniref:Membrane protein involved in the export of O-antigen and teichoic acid n=1 Tax=Ekhidna lutea TaxID=447679 RepID=A0A239FJQ4_EKHLU|nr:oligosaccharide flippase family protein [Ekhidna lutea]SNS56304.1 Membrane protein involved in the export of O-antigen and teichoic acid [Ekhidna lutea]
MSLLKNASYFTIGGILNKVIPFFILPAITHLLTPEEFGIFSMFEVAVVTLLPFILVQQNGAIGVNYYKLNFEQNGQYISSVLIIPFTMFLVSILLILLFSHSISSMLSIPEEWLVFIPTVSFFQSLFLINNTTLIFRKKPIQYLYLEIGRTILFYGGGLIALYFFSNSWKGLGGFMTLAYGVFGLIAFIQLIKFYKLKPRLNAQYLKDGLLYGGPLIIHVFSQSVIDLSDRYFITEMIGVEYAGIYTIAYRFGMINFFLFKFFQQAWNPYVFEILEGNKSKEKKGLVKKLIIIIVGIACLAAIVAIIAPFYVRFFLDSSYQLAISVIPWICSAYAFRSIYGVLSVFLFHKKKTVTLSILTFTNAIINLVLNYYLIGLYGFVGAAIATLITFILSSTILLLLLLKMYGSPLNKLK